MIRQTFIRLAQERNLMTISKPYGIQVGEYTLMFEDAYGNVYEEPLLFKGDNLVEGML